MLRLKNIQKWQSVKPFAEISLPDLTILTGLNGSGKSQLLKSIVHGFTSIGIERSNEETEEIINKQNECVLIENSSLMSNELLASFASEIGSAPKHNINFTSGSTLDEKSFYDFKLRGLHQILTGCFPPDPGNAEKLYTLLRNRFASSGDINQDSVKNCIIDLLGFDDEQTQLVIDDVQKEFSMPDPVFRRHPTIGDQITARVKSVSDRVSKKPIDITFDEISILDSWGHVPMFNPEIAKVFSAYRDALMRNDLAVASVKRGGQVEALNHEEFVRKYGPPPWDDIDTLLSELGLPYKVGRPSWDPSDLVHFNLIKNFDNEPIGFRDLSSGERVLVHLALSMYRADPLRTQLLSPKIVLIDEMDASLHPEMTHRWLSAVSKEIVEKRGIRCILTTHSPTTVALAAEESLYQMDGGGSPRKVTKQQALNRLTFGVPALSIGYDGRLQVIVESSTDAAAYEMMVNILKADLKLARTLTFIAPGPKVDGIEQNTGCVPAEHLVNELTNNGVESVYGILDWDGRRVGGERIKVLSEGAHYSFENIILNPLLIGMLMIRDQSELAGTYVRAASFQTMSIADAQSIADAVQNRISFIAGVPSLKLPLNMIGGLTVDVFQAYNQINGHELEKLLVSSFPSLKGFRPQKRGSLAESVIKHVLIDWRQYTPSPIADVFRQLAGVES